MYQFWLLHVGVNFHIVAHPFIAFYSSVFQKLQLGSFEYDSTPSLINYANYWNPYL